MKPFIAAYLCVALVFLPTVGYAQEASETPVECDKAIPLTSPCSGVLLPTEAASEGLKCLQIDIPRLKLELQFNKDLWETRENRYQLLLQAEQARGDKYFQLHQEAVVLSKPWYESPVLWFFTGFAVATAATIGITHAVNDGK